MRWSFEAVCYYYYGIDLRAPTKIWQKSNFDCGGPYWVVVDSIKIGDTVGNSEGRPAAEIIDRINKHEWRVLDNLTYHKVILKMKQIETIPDGCRLETN